MHAERIASLEARLAILDQKVDDGWPESLVAADRETTTAVLEHLRGIEARNVALAAEAPVWARRDALQARRANWMRERRQKSLGERPPLSQMPRGD